MSRLRLATAAGFGLGALLVASMPAAADSSADAAVLAGSCANCHGTDGRSPGPIVPIAGRPETILRGQLRAFKSETPPPGTTIMNRIAKGYTDEQLDALAKYFAAVKPAAAKGAK